jgi:hypothetical protein
MTSIMFKDANNYISLLLKNTHVLYFNTGQNNDDLLNKSSICLTLLAIFTYSTTNTILAVVVLVVYCFVA